MSDRHEILTPGDAESKKPSHAADDLKGAASSALKGAAQGAAVGGFAGAAAGALKSGAIALGKSKTGRNIILSALAVSTLPLIAIILLISMFGSMSGSNAAIRSSDLVASNLATYAKDFKPEEVAIFQQAGVKYNIPWELLAAIVYVERSSNSGAGAYRLTLDPDTHQPVHKGQKLDYLTGAAETYAITDAQAKDLSTATDLIARVIRDSFNGNVNDLSSSSLTSGSILTNSDDPTKDHRVIDANNLDDVATAKRVEAAYLVAIKRLPIHDSDNKASSIFERARQFALGQAGSAVCSALPVASGVWGDPLVAQTTSPFGSRTDPITGDVLNHDGQDLAGLPEGTPFYSASDGTVLQAFGTGGPEGDGDGGNGIIIDAGGGVQLWYWHASPGTAKVKAGDKVRTGQVLAGIGTTGHSTGVHLHFQIMENGVAVEPVAFMAARGVKLGVDAVGGTAASPAPATATATNWNNAQAFTASDANGIPITLSPEQLNNASIIIGVGKSLGLNDKDITVALITALQESKLKVLSNITVFPESSSIPNQGDGSDHDSLGIFQQRPPWGTPSQVMDPTDSAKRFFGGPSGPNHGSPAGLIDVLAARGGMTNATPGEIAQAVQVSAFPDAYASWVPVAQQLLSTVTGTSTPTSCASAPGAPASGGDVSTGITFTGDVSAARQALTKYAEQGLGGNYVWGGTEFKAWDCSGYFQWVYKQTGITVPRVEQWSAGKKTMAPKPGDLVVMHADGFDTAGKANHWSHVGMYAGEKNGQPMFYNALNPDQGTLLVPVTSVGDDAEYFNLFND